jgi:hypothetical protein
MRFTVIFNDDLNDYVTLRLKDCAFDDMPEGTQIAEYLSGPDNEQDYTGFAFVLGDVIRVWKRFNHESRPVIALKALLQSDDFYKYGEAYAKVSGNCFRCGRTLTVPISLHRGLGPVCAQLMGLE